MKKKQALNKKYQIDQSGKIEQTNKTTVIAYSNDNQFALVIPARLKRRIQEVFRLHGFSSLFTYYLFSVGLFYLIQHLEKEENITIDTEYPGKEKIITSFLKHLLIKNKKPDHRISFARIGNRPPAHYAAKDVFDKKKKPDKTLRLEDVIRAIKKTDGRLRECLSTLVYVQTRSIKTKYHKKIKKSRVDKKSPRN